MTKTLSITERDARQKIEAEGTRYPTATVWWPRTAFRLSFERGGYVRGNPDDALAVSPGATPNVYRIPRADPEYLATLTAPTAGPTQSADDPLDLTVPSVTPISDAGSAFTDAPMTDLDRFNLDLVDLYAGMRALLCLKRQSYGTTNLTRFGPIGIVIRASDKIDRLVNLLQTGADASADGDTIEDTWMDIIGYGTLGLYELRRARSEGGR